MTFRLFVRSLRRPTLTTFRASASASTYTRSRLLTPQLSFADNVSQVRSFSSEDSPSATAQLASLLQRELDEEDENETALMPEELTELKAQLDNDWRIDEGMPGESGATIKMFKKDATGGGKISVIFHCQDTVNVDDEGEAEDEEEEPAVPVRFTVTVTKAGKTMVITCLSEDAEAIVESVAMTDGDAEQSAIGGIDSTLYQGPEFVELAEDVQDAFNEYVQNDCGVDRDVAAFIAMYSDFREQAEYVRWLKLVKGIL